MNIYTDILDYLGSTRKDIDMYRICHSLRDLIPGISISDCVQIAEEYLDCGAGSHEAIVIQYKDSRNLILLDTRQGNLLKPSIYLDITDLKNNTLYTPEIITGCVVTPIEKLDSIVLIFKINTDAKNSTYLL